MVAVACDRPIHDAGEGGRRGNNRMASLAPHASRTHGLGAARDEFRSWSSVEKEDIILACLAKQS